MDTPNPNNKPLDNSNKTLMAILCYLGVLIIVPFVTESQKDPFVKFHIKQGLVLLIAWIIASMVFVIPVLGWMIGWILWLAVIVLMIMGIINAANGQEKELPVLGQFAKNFNF